MSKPINFFAYAETFRQIETFCRSVYHQAFGPEEGERRLRRLTLPDALDLWFSGLPHSGGPPN